MAEIKVIYWSQSGNTQAMAEAIGRGIESAGATAKVSFVTEVSVNDVKDDKVFALGCPAMGAEVLEEADMEPFVAELESYVSGKTIGLFGSYGWGDGEWMRDWVDRMSAAGATILNGEGLMCNETPDDGALAECEEFGKQLAANA